MTKCFHCNGYYGPSFGQPVCTICHMFLYANESSLQSTYAHFYDKVEDGDSGNEEPKEPSDCQLQTNSSNDLRHMERPFDNGENFSSANNATENVALLVTNHQNAQLNVEQYANSDDAESDSAGEQTSATFLPPGSCDCDNDDGLSDCSKTVIQKIPPEVLLLVFQKLDEISLWSVGQVCRDWNLLVRNNFNDKWKMFTHRRWPLFSALYEVENWHKVFTNLIESAPCQLCLLQISHDTNPKDQDNSWRRNRLIGELRTLRCDPPEGIMAFPLDEMSLHWQASIRGPAGSPYQGGTFFFYIQIPPNYPLRPPLVRFITKIFHPNVSRHGDIGIDSIQHNWSLALTISKVLISIQSLLTDPFTKVCMEPQIGDMYDNNRSLFDRIARAWTWRYAMHDAIDPESMIPQYLQNIMSEDTINKLPHSTTSQKVDALLQ